MGIKSSSISEVYKMRLFHPDSLIIVWTCGHGSTGKIESFFDDKGMWLSPKYFNVVCEHYPVLY